LLIILLLTAFSVSVTAVFIVGSAYWQKIDPQSTGKLLVQRMWNAASRDTRHLIERLPLNGLRSRLFRSQRQEHRDS
jgi:hypothetical protein